MKKGEKVSEEMRIKFRKARNNYLKTHPVGYWKGKKLGDRLSKEGRLRIIEGLKRRKISPKVIAHASNLNKGKTGDVHPCWKQNKKRPLYQSIRSLYEYRNWRDSIYRRDNYTCSLCKKRGGDIEADHFPKMFIEIITEYKIDTIEKAQVCEKLWDLQNGRVLCLQCHRNTFNWGRANHAKRLSEKTSEKKMRQSALQK